MNIINISHDEPCISPGTDSLYKFCCRGYNTGVQSLHNFVETEEQQMVLDRIALILAIIGALNWGSVGIFGFDAVAFFCGGQMAILSRIIYALVGLAGLWCISLLFREREEHGQTHTA